MKIVHETYKQSLLIRIFVGKKAKSKHSNLEILVELENGQRTYMRQKEVEALVEFEQKHGAEPFYVSQKKK